VCSLSQAASRLSAEGPSSSCSHSADSGSSTVDAVLSRSDCTSGVAIRRTVAARYSVEASCGRSSRLLLADGGPHEDRIPARPRPGFPTKVRGSTFRCPPRTSPAILSSGADGTAGAVQKRSGWPYLASAIITRGSGTTGRCRFLERPDSRHAFNPGKARTPHTTLRECQLVSAVMTNLESSPMHILANGTASPLIAALDIGGKDRGITRRRHRRCLDPDVAVGSRRR
jgi:hypothetical protein